jgi:ribosomal protein L7/L12
MNNYAKAITILGGQFDATKMLFEIAKSNPKVLCNAYEKLYPGKPDWRPVAISLIRADKYIDAIKHCRAETGLALKEAKEACDELREKIAWRAE